MMRPLTADLNQRDARPYFLWDEDISVAELDACLRTGDPVEQARLIGKMLREARDVDVWRFLTPQEVQAWLPRVERRVGARRLAFWKWLLAGWKSDGYLD